MNIELKVGGNVVVKVELDSAVISKLLQLNPYVIGSENIPRSTPFTKAQAEELLSRIDAKSAVFLRQIAANNGTITWGKMREIFGIAKSDDDWTTFASGYGKGITRALRHILNDKSARLFWWSDEDEEWKCDDDGVEKWNSDAGLVHVDGRALQALREATN
jgi:hypothetical protein